MRCPREFLATLFWPEKNQQQALANLRRTLASLNASLPGWIEADRDSISIKRNQSIWTDVDSFHNDLLLLKKHDTRAVLR
jgi:DNA-binding SARP family transcriptional activator